MRERHDADYLELEIWRRHLNPFYRFGPTAWIFTVLVIIGVAIFGFWKVAWATFLFILAMGTGSIAFGLFGLGVVASMSARDDDGRDWPHVLGGALAAFGSGVAITGLIQAGWINEPDGEAWGWFLVLRMIGLMSLLVGAVAAVVAGVIRRRSGAARGGAPTRTRAP